MNITTNIIALDDPQQKTSELKSRRKFTRSLEYEIIANLVLLQYQNNDGIRFDLLYAIGSNDRIPALTEEYGKKRMHKLLVTLLKEFSISIPLPKSKKLNDTRISVCACDLMISAQEDALSMEDLILFFERTKQGKYGAVRKYLTHQLIKEKLEMYLLEREEGFKKITEQKNTELKSLGTEERICEEPKQIGDILKQASVIQMNKRMSG